MSAVVIAALINIGLGAGCADENTGEAPITGRFRCK
jgi:hypothetical protein